MSQLTTLPADESVAVQGTALEVYSARDEVRELGTRLMRLHPAAREVGDEGMLAVAQLALLVGANPLPGTNEIHVWHAKGKTTIDLGINYFRRKGKEHGGWVWSDRPREMTPQEYEDYGVNKDTQIGAICAGVCTSEMIAMRQAGFTVNEVYGMCGEIGHGTVNIQEEVKKGRTRLWTAQKRAEKDLLKKLFPGLERPKPGGEVWRDQIVTLNGDKPHDTDPAQILKDNIALLRGDHDEDDPFGMDTPSIIRTPEPVAVDDIDVDPATGELLGGNTQPPAPPHPMRQNGEAQADDSEPTRIDRDPDAFDPDALAAFVARVDKATGNYYDGHAPSLIDDIRTESGNHDVQWPDVLDNEDYSYDIALRYINNNT